MAVYYQGDPRQIIEECRLCGQPTGRCEDDTITVGGVGPYCEECASDLDRLCFVPDVDALSNFIRRIDGNHDMGAGALAERICEWLKDQQ